MQATRGIIRAGLCAAMVMSSAGVLAAEAYPPPKAAEGDQAFLKQALGVNELELRLGRLAAERASTPELKAMGQRMVQKHTELGGKLSELARQAGASGDAELSPEQQETLARVESQSGSAFDAAFKETVDSGHVKELAMYQDEVSHAASPQLRALAEQRVTALQQSMAAGAQPKKSKQ